jgi:hypothetical protein
VSVGLGVMADLDGGLGFIRVLHPGLTHQFFP